MCHTGYTGHLRRKFSRVLILKFAIDDEESRRGVGVACRRHYGIRPVRQGFMFTPQIQTIGDSSNDRRFGVMVGSLASRVNAIDPYEIHRHPKTTAKNP